MPNIHALTEAIGFLALSIAAIYAGLNVVAVSIWNLRPYPGKSPARSPVTVLKPLCGAEPGSYEYLRSFLQQDYPDFQIVFGVRDPADPACAIVERLMAEFPLLPVKLVVNPQLHGSNGKISNLINMLPFAEHDILVIADSDALVGPDYLATVVAPLRDAKTGLVTCIYRGLPTQSVWSRLGAMYINEWYVPSVILAWLFGHQGYVSGQTVCLRRDTLQAIGGLTSLSDHLADDYRLGSLVRNLKLRIVLSRYVVTGEHHEISLHSMIHHELRWMRTLRVLKPGSFRWLFLTFSLPLAVIGMGLVSATSTRSSLAQTLFWTTLLARFIVHLAHRLQHEDRAPFADVLLVPARDFLLCWVWCQSFFASRVTWRGAEFDVDSDGIMRRLG
jgi:ceramide glucosyltransferase